MGRHAYLILCHQYDYTLETLIKLLDDERNDIYVHIDLKTNDFFPLLKGIVKLSNIYNVKNRIKVYWADISIVKAEYELYNAAYNRGGYDYYHLLSGADLPLKSQNYIHKFFEDYSGFQFLGVSYPFVKSNNKKDRLSYIIPFPHYQNRNRCGFWGMVGFVINIMFEYVQQILGWPFKIKDYSSYAQGPAWCSVTHDFVKCLLDNETMIVKALSNRYAIDEVYKQFIFCNNKGYRLYNENDQYESCLRLIDWTRGNPYSYTIDDFDEIIKSNRLFCRKIYDEDLADAIFRYISSHRL